MLSNAHFLAKFRFDTAENEPAKNRQHAPEDLGAVGSHGRLSPGGWGSRAERVPRRDLLRLRHGGRPLGGLQERARAPGREVEDVE